MTAPKAVHTLGDLKVSKNRNDVMKTSLRRKYRRSPTYTFWDFEKTVLHEICVSGTVGGPLLFNKKIPHLPIHKPKTVVVENVYRASGGPP